MAKFSIEPKSGLFDKVCSRIQKEERSFSIKRIALFSAILSICALTFAPSLKMLISDLNSTGFLHFLALAFSDTSIIATYWKNFLFILIESMPTISLAIFLTIIVGILQSIKYLVKDIKFVINAKA